MADVAAITLNMIKILPIQELLENDPNGLVKCVFWQFDKM